MALIGRRPNDVGGLAEKKEARVRKRKGWSVGSAKARHYAVSTVLSSVSPPINYDDVATNTLRMTSIG